MFWSITKVLGYFQPADIDIIVMFFHDRKKTKILVLTYSFLAGLQL